MNNEKEIVDILVRLHKAHNDLIPVLEELTLSIPSEHNYCIKGILAGLGETSHEFSWAVRQLMGKDYE